jgi:hypothetical protein
MARFVLDRRTVLRGAGGLAMALPPLEIMSRSGTARAATAPRRFVMAYGGSSLGTEKDRRAETIVTPTSTGLDYQPSIAFAPLADPASNVKADVTIVSGLKLPWGSSPPPGGRVPGFHGNTTVPQFTGTRTGRTPGPSADQIVAGAIAGNTLQRSLVLKVQPIDYLGAASGPKGRISFNRSGSGMDAIGSPHAVYQSLFSGFVPPPTGPASKPATPAPPPPELIRRKSIMDFVHTEIDSLLPRLGRADRARLQAHFDEIRDIERQIALLWAGGTGGAVSTAMCALPADAPDPALGPNSKTGYSNEDLRAKLMTDLIHMAFACDRTRVVSLLYTFAQCFMGCTQILPSGNGSDLHEIGHGAGTVTDQANVIRWHIKHFASLVARLRATPDVDGRTILDNTALTLLFEGGWGLDPSTGKMWSPHSTERMVVVIAGGRAGGLKHKGHLVAQDKHPAQVLISAMNAAGVDMPLGEVSGNIPDLFA